MNSIVDILSLVAILSSVLVITSKNPVVAVIFLISLFINTAGYLILFGISFVGISYVIIYCGGIIVLFLFVILMINIRLSDILESGSQYTKNLPLAFFVGCLFIYEIYSITPFTFNNVNIINLFHAAVGTALDSLYNFTTVLGVEGLPHSIDITPSISTTQTCATYATLPDFIIKEFSQIAALGQGIYTYGALGLIIVSLILLLSMIAAIAISGQVRNIN